MINAYPLQWPTGWPRANSFEKKHGRFSTREYRGSSSYKSAAPITVTESVNRILTELAAMDIDRQDIVISTNVRTRLDGLPRSGEKEPDDSGAAVYWTTRGHEEHKVMAIDVYYCVADNLAAVAATLQAMRAIERHGGAQILERAFTGFTALPAPGQSKSWRDILGIYPGIDDLDFVRHVYRKLASENHPDRGGDTARMAEINKAWAEAQEALRP